MTNSILIGKAIYNLLKNDNTTHNYVGDKIFPLVAENETTFPFIAYSRENVNGSTGYTKDGCVGDDVQFRVDIVSDSYNESCEIALAVRTCLEKPYLALTETIPTNDPQNPQVVTIMRIYECKMYSINESYDSETFIQTMRFVCKVA